MENIHVNYEITTRSEGHTMTKVYHKAKHINPNGDVSALCFKRPRKINLKKSAWVVIDENVTCPKCKKILDREKP